MSIILELGTIVLTLGLYHYMTKKKHKHVVNKMGIMAVAVFLFGLVSEHIWHNKGFSSWAYLFGDVSWVLILGFSNLFFISLLITDYYWKKQSEARKFWYTLGILTIISVPFEIYMLKAGIKVYDPVLLNSLSGLYIPLTNAPLEIIPSVPIIGALILPFYKTMVRYFKL